MATSTSDATESPLVPNVTLAFSDDLESLSIRASPNQLPLYNPDSTLEIPLDVADGFLILLSAGRMSARTIRKEQEKVKKCLTLEKNCKPAAQSPTLKDNEIDLSSIQLCFAALTEGNVIEATFGVETNGGMRRSKFTSERAYNAAKTAKSAILDACMTSDAIRQLAVETYCRCFEIVITYDVDLQSIGFISWCLKHQKVRDSAEKRLQAAFTQLHEAIAASA